MTKLRHRIKRINRRNLLERIANRWAGHCEDLDGKESYQEAFRELHRLWRTYPWFTPAAACLGYYYYKGLGVHRNARKGFWFSKRGMRGEDEVALHNVAISYLDGEGVARNLNRGLRLLNRAKRWGFIPKSQDSQSMDAEVGC